MIDEKRFEKIMEFEGKTFGYLKKPWTISVNNVRDCSSDLDKADIQTNLAPSLKEIGMQQIPVVNAEGEVFIGGRRAIGWELNGEVTLLVEIRDISDEDQMAGSWGENYTKRDMTADQEGKLFKRMQDEFKLSTRDLSKKLGGISHATISRKIQVHDFSVLRGVTVPHDSPNDSPKLLNYGKVAELLPLSKEDQDKMVNEIKEKGMTRDQIREVVKQARGIKELLDSYTEEQKKEIEEAIEPLMFSKDVKTSEIIHEINEATESSQKTVTKKVDYDLYSNQEEADTLYFSPRGGRCLGDQTEKYWIGTIDPIKAKEIEEASENETN